MGTAVIADAIGAITLTDLTDQKAPDDELVRFWDSDGSMTGTLAKKWRLLDKHVALTCCPTSVLKPERS
jgi:hypothetical protein